ncbi:endonuclease/exonuclease/phosphatase family protein [Actinoalloteichus spitiensis]|uniref:endonuclease/exonuclease/phosphatase family protein n=1 Tax=Actinoalloteichus spitiensis TaxID=252394 RepID=UPI00035E070B|nr:endonuclease/exonuclease/phosphatase family protein [Actinoalloteichus spitiensis]
MTFPSLPAPRRAAAALTALVAGAGLATLPTEPPARAAEEPAAASALISEVYGGGGNSGATLTTDFVELGNPGDHPVTLEGWSVQYLPGSPRPTSQWQYTPLTGEIPAGGHFLVSQARGNAGSVELPTPDVRGNIAMSATAGTIALVNGTDRLDCLTLADCAADTRIVDLVGYGDAVVRNGEPARGASNTRSVARDADLTDTRDNAADFTAGEPNPVNSSGETPGEPGEPGNPPGEPGEPGELRIHDIQGPTRISPHTGSQVSGVPGIVTAVNAFGSPRGFWFQDPEPDGDPRTSEALFVFTSDRTPDLAVGDEVLVSGTVVQYRQGGASSANQSLTQLERASWEVVSSGNDLPEAELVTPSTVPTALAPDASGGSIEDLELDPERYALDYYASREGMLLRVDDAPVVGPTDAYNALWVTTKPAQNRSARGGTVYQGYGDSNTGRLKIESLIPFSERPFPIANVGDELRGTTQGPLWYSQYGGYLIRATTLGEHVDNGLTRDAVRPARDWELTVATYNVENLSPADDQAKFDRLATGVAEYLDGPDIVALEEIQDNSGPTDDGVVDADQTLDQFVDAIRAAGGPSYEWRQINPEDKEDGGQPGGNIRNAFLFNPARVSFVDAPGGDATTAVRVESDGDGGARLSVSPGRIAPDSPAWDNSRKPLVGQFRFEDRDVFVVANHFNSKGGDQSLHGRYQPPNRTSEIQRLEQAAVVRQFSDALYAEDPSANLLVVGDLNDFQFSPVLTTLTQGGRLHNPMLDLPPTERYGYVFDGNSQSLDHILVAGALAHRADYQPVRVNAEFADQASDHDPQVVAFRPLSGDPAVDEAEDAKYYGGGRPPGEGGDTGSPERSEQPGGGAGDHRDVGPPGAAGEDLARTGLGGVLPLVTGAVILLAVGGAAAYFARRKRGEANSPDSEGTGTTS